MNDLLKCSVVALLSTLLLSSSPSQAMEIEMFDRLSVEDQQDYLQYLVGAAKKVLVEQDRKAEAVKGEEVFKKVPAGSKRSVGHTQFETHLASIRKFSASAPAGFHFTRPYGRVEGAFIRTLDQNGVKPTAKFVQALTQLTTEKPFWPKRPLRSN